MVFRSLRAAIACVLVAAYLFVVPLILTAAVANPLISRLAVDASAAQQASYLWLTGVLSFLAAASCTGLLLLVSRLLRRPRSELLAIIPLSLVAIVLFLSYMNWPDLKALGDSSTALPLAGVVAVWAAALLRGFARSRKHEDSDMAEQAFPSGRQPRRRADSRKGVACRRQADEPPLMRGH